MVIGRNFKPGFRINLHQKDLRNALLAAESLKVSLPFTSLVQQMLLALINDGKGNLDHSAIVTFIEDMAGIEIKKAMAAGSSRQHAAVEAVATVHGQHRMRVTE